MKTIIANLFLVLTLTAEVSFAQSQIQQGVNFFRKENGAVPINTWIASVYDSDGYGVNTTRGTASHLSVAFKKISNGGLSFLVELRFDDYRREGTGPIFSGEVNLTSCIRENGQNIFGQFKSLEDVFRYSHETANSTQFSSCLYSGISLVSNYQTPNGAQPFPTIENFKLYIFADHIELKGQLKGESESSKTGIPFKTPFLYYKNIDAPTSLAAVREKTLSILNSALVILQGESGNKQLPKTVAYIMENRKELQNVLRQIENRNVDTQELLEFSVSVKNAFHILDQAVGLASDRQIQMSQLIQVR